MKFPLLILAAAALGAGAVFYLPFEANTASAQQREVALTRSGDGHFYADAKVNGVSVRFLVDTGASQTGLSTADAKRAGITVDPDEFELIGEGVSGVVRGKMVELATLDVQGFAVTDVKAAVVQGAQTSLLGQPFLETIDEIVIRKDEMLLRAKS
ncbi:MAG: TIGR02281 family clan AA aspartic protease [Sphingomonas sp.]|nr:TIGR02281 family clan AA aspartic protease [Sphingomonas sp.]